MEWSGVEWSGVERSGVEGRGGEWRGGEGRGGEWSGVEWSGVECVRAGVRGCVRVCVPERGLTRLHLVHPHVDTGS